MSTMIRTSKGCISISEVDGMLVHAVVGKAYRDLNLTEPEFEALYNAFKNDPSPAAMQASLDDIIANRSNDKATTKTPKDERANQVKQALNKMIAFFKEFQFTPSYRFVNTLANICKVDVEQANNYIRNYFALMDSSYAGEVADKIKSMEFRRTMNTFAENVDPTKTINTRLRIFYGAQGTGKTTEAMKYTNTAIVCNSAMQPCDLIEDFTFDDGKAAFHPSALVRAMEKGETVLLDEMNLLPFDSLRFLQGICDGKETFEWKGNTIHIHEGFNIIGTMNLVVNGTTFGLPEPIVDRCSELREFTLTAEALLGAI